MHIKMELVMEKRNRKNGEERDRRRWREQLMKKYTGNSFILAVFHCIPTLAAPNTHYHLLLPRVHTWASAQAVVLAMSVSLPCGIVQWRHCGRVFQRRPVTLFAHSSEQDLCKLSCYGLQTHTHAYTHESLAKTLAPNIPRNIILMILSLYGL